MTKTKYTSVQVDVRGNEDKPLSTMVSELRSLDSSKTLGYFIRVDADSTDENILWFHFTETSNR